MIDTGGLSYQGFLVQEKHQYGSLSENTKFSKPARSQIRMISALENLLSIGVPNLSRESVRIE